MPFVATQKGLETVASEINQTEKEKCHMASYMWNQKETVQMNLSASKQTHRLRMNLRLLRGRMWWVG